MLAKRLQLELDEFRKCYHTEPDADDICGLVEACQRLEKPDGRLMIGLISAPFQVADTDVYLWPLTVGASVWLDTYAFRWWDGDDNRTLYAMAFAMANARNCTLLARLTDEAETFREIKAFLTRLGVSKEELGAAVDEVLDLSRQDEADPNAESVDWSEVVSELENTTGISKDVWLWGNTMAYTAEAYHTARNVLCRMAGGTPSKAGDSLSLAINHLAFVKKQIYLKYQNKVKEEKAK